MQLWMLAQWSPQGRLLASEPEVSRQVVRKGRPARLQCLRPVILATQEAEIRRIMVRSQTGQIVPETLFGKNSSQKSTCLAGVKPWVQIPVLPKKKKGKGRSEAGRNPMLHKQDPIKTNDAPCLLLWLLTLVRVSCRSQGLIHEADHTSLAQVSEVSCPSATNTYYRRAMHPFIPLVAHFKHKKKEFWEM
jgi:hypothetical protein